jgi:alpha-tubulin suppressor-like RCC1 family protein
MKKLAMSFPGCGILLSGIVCHCVSANLIAGQVVGWGDNVAGQATGIPSFPQSNGAVVVGDNPFATGRVVIAGLPLSNAIAVCAGHGFSLALLADNTVVGWGDNQMGRAIGAETAPPHRASGAVVVHGQALTNITSIAAGGAFGLALRQDGRVVTWGKNTVPPGLTNVVAIAASGFFSAAVKRDGSVVSWASDPQISSRVPKPLDNVAAIACGGGPYERGMALKKNGTVVLWGVTSPDEDPPAGLTNVVGIASGGCHSLVLHRDGTVFGWGCNSFGQATGTPTVGDPGQSLSASGLVTIGGATLTNVAAIAAAKAHSLALTRDGKVIAWGDKRLYRGVPGDLTNAVAIAAGDGFCLAIQQE